MTRVVTNHACNQVAVYKQAITDALDMCKLWNTCKQLQPGVELAIWLGFLHAATLVGDRQHVPIIMRFLFQQQACLAAVAAVLYILRWLNVDVSCLFMASKTAVVKMSSATA